jgi:hypothetical protein
LVFVFCKLMLERKTHILLALIANPNQNSISNQKYHESIKREMRIHILTLAMAALPLQP